MTAQGIKAGARVRSLDPEDEGAEGEVKLSMPDGFLRVLWDQDAHNETWCMASDVEVVS